MVRAVRQTRRRTAADTGGDRESPPRPRRRRGARRRRTAEALAGVRRRRRPSRSRAEAIATGPDGPQRSRRHRASRSTPSDDDEGDDEPEASGGRPTVTTTEAAADEPIRARRARTRPIGTIRGEGGRFAPGAVLGRGVSGDPHPAFLRVTITGVPSSVPSSRNPSSRRRPHGLGQGLGGDLLAVRGQRRRGLARRLDAQRDPVRRPRGRPPSARPGSSRTSSRANPSRRSSGVTSSSRATVTPPSDATPNPDRTSWMSCDVLRADRDGGPVVHDHLDRARRRPIARRASRRPPPSAAATACTRGPRRGPRTLKSGLGAPAAEHLGGSRDVDALHVQLFGHRVPQAIERSGRARRDAPPPRRAAGASASWSPSGSAARARRPGGPAPSPRRDPGRPSLVTPRVVGEVHGVRLARHARRRGSTRSPPRRTGERSEERGRGDQALVQRVERASLSAPPAAARVPEPATRASDVPVREVVDERLDPPAGARRVVAIHPVADLTDGAGEPGEDPPIEEGPRRSAGAGCASGSNPLGVRVEHEERVDVPERQQELAHRLFQHRVAEPP